MPAKKRRGKLDALDDPLVFLDRHVDFAALAAKVDRVAPRPISEHGGGRPPYPTETMVRILIPKRLHTLLLRAAVTWMGAAGRRLA